MTKNIAVICKSLPSRRYMNKTDSLMKKMLR